MHQLKMVGIMQKITKVGSKMLHVLLRLRRTTLMGQLTQETEAEMTKEINRNSRGTKKKCRDMSSP